MKKIIFFVFAYSGLLNALDLRVLSDEAKIYEEPSNVGVPVFKVRKGQKIHSSGKSENGFYELKDKKGTILWVSDKDVQVITGTSSLRTLEQGAEQKREERQYEGADFDRFHYNFAGGRNFNGGVSAFELSLNIYYYFYSWLAWKNSLFYRFADTDSSSGIGLDTSVLGMLNFGPKAFRIGIYAGPGYRLAAVGAPFVEGGIGFSVFRSLSVGLSAKQLFYSSTNSSYKDQTIVGFSFGGSGSF